MVTVYSGEEDIEEQNKSHPHNFYQRITKEETDKSIRVYKSHLKMVKGCRIDTGPCKKGLSKKDPPKTLGTRVSCKTGTGLDGQRARQA